MEKLLPKKQGCFLCEKEAGGFEIYPDLVKEDIVEKLSLLKTKRINLY